mgnify:FL=1
MESGANEPVKLSFKNGYELELAIDAKNEVGVVKILSKFFGDRMMREVSFSEIGKYGDLFFVKHRFTEEELTDDVYKKILKDSRIIIISDVLSLKRGSQVIKKCLTVEVFLKRLLTYVYPGILDALDGKPDKKKRVKICRQINSWYLKEILDRIEFDMTAKVREQLLVDNGAIIANALNDASDFTDFKKRMNDYIKPNTVWDQINTILEKPIDYSEIKVQLHELSRLRNDAAHANTILKEDVLTATKYSKSVIRKMGAVKNDYNKALLESMSKLTETFSKFTKNITSELFKELNTNMGKMISDTMSAAVSSIHQSLPQIYQPPNLAEIFKGVDWVSLDSKLRNEDPEMKEILERFDDHPVGEVLDDMNDEITELSQETEEDCDDKEDENEDIKRKE